MSGAMTAMSGAMTDQVQDQPFLEVRLCLALLALLSGATPQAMSLVELVQRRPAPSAARVMQRWMLVLRPRMLLATLVMLRAALLARLQRLRPLVAPALQA